MSQDLQKRVEVLEAQVRSLARINAGLVKAVRALGGEELQLTPEDNHRAIRARRGARRAAMGEA